MRLRSYWLDTLDSAPDVHSGDLPARCDAAVIGGGLTGLSAALALSKRGTHVVLLEAHEVGWGASSRNGGMVLSGLKLGPHELIARYGTSEARALDAASIQAIDFVERIIREEEIACDFARCGHLALASKAAHYEQFKRDAALIAHAFGRPVRLVARDQLAEEIRSTAYHGAMVDDASAAVNPAKLVSGLARAAGRAGAALCERTAVFGVRRRTDNASSGFSVVTERGTLNAGAVIVATGAYTGAETPWLRRRIVPIGSYIIATEPLSDSVAHAISPRGRMMFDSKHYLHYFRLTTDRRLLFGGRASFVPESERAVVESAQILGRDMVELLPQLRDVKVEYAWGGTIDFTCDMLPHAGVADGVHYAAGYAGHGVALATYLGAQLAATLAGNAVDNPFMRHAFSAPPLGAQRIVPGLVGAVGAWYRFLDAVS